MSYLYRAPSTHFSQTKECEKHNAFFNFIFERTIHLDQKKWNKHLGSRQLGERDYLLDPSTNASLVWSLINTLFDMIYTPFILPVILAFSTLEVWNGWMILEFICGVFFVMIFFSNISFGYIVWINNDFKILRDFNLGFYFHIRYGQFITDFLSIVPFISLIGFMILDLSGKFQIFIRIIYFIRLIRLVRIFRVLSKSSFSQTLFTLYEGNMAMTISKTVLIANILYVGLFIINILSCLWFGIARIQGYTHSWMNGLDLDLSPNIEAYIASLYFVMTTLTTVGYGDITATNELERLIAVIIMIAGVSYFLILVGFMSDVFIFFNNLQQTNKIVKKIENVKQLGRLYSNVDRTLRNRVKMYYQDIWLYEYETNESLTALFEDIPGSLRISLIQELTGNAFENIDRLERFSDEHRLLIIANLINVPLTWKEQELCNFGQPFKHYWLLVEGVLKIDDREVEAPYFIGEEIQRDGFITNTMIMKRSIVFKIEKDLFEKIEQMNEGV
jgi:hypothetical protein